MKKLLFIPAAIIAALSLTALADAHTPSVVPSCSGLTITLTQYEGNATNNLVTIGIDNQPPGGVTFASSYSHTFTWSQTANHSYSVQIDANRNSGDPTAYDRVFTGTSTACQVAPTTTTTPATTSTAVTTIPADTVPTTEPTTTVVAVGEPPVPCTYNIVLSADNPLCVPPVPADPTTTAVLFTSDLLLPRTGPRPSNTGLEFAGVFAVFCGLVALRVARRP